MLSSPWKKRILLTSLPILFLTALLLGGMAGNQQGNLSGNVLRLHILGRTDSEYDQSLKLAVRDQVLLDYRPLFSGAANAADAALRAEIAVPQIKETAERVLRRHGCLAPVTVQVKEHPFPTKTYGSVSLPAGNYTAVNIRIGEALGANWWCVLYPPLCLTEGSVQADKTSLSLLQSHLPPEEFALLTQPDKVTFRMKFKILELFGKFFS